MLVVCQIMKPKLLIMKRSRGNDNLVGIVRKYTAEIVCKAQTISANMFDGPMLVFLERKGVSILLAVF